MRKSKKIRRKRCRPKKNSSPCFSQKEKYMVWCGHHIFSPLGLVCESRADRRSGGLSIRCRSYCSRLCFSRSAACSLVGRPRLVFALDSASAALATDELDLLIKSANDSDSALASDWPSESTVLSTSSEWSHSARFSLKWDELRVIVWFVLAAITMLPTIVSTTYGHGSHFVVLFCVCGCCTRTKSPTVRRHSRTFIRWSYSCFIQSLPFASLSSANALMAFMAKIRLFPGIPTRYGRLSNNTGGGTLVVECGVARYATKNACSSWSLDFPEVAARLSTLFNFCMKLSTSAFALGHNGVILWFCASQNTWRSGIEMVGHCPFCTSAARQMWRTGAPV